VAAAGPYQVAWRDAIKEILRRQEDYDGVVVTSMKTGHIGIQYLFYSQIDPVTYFEAPRSMLRKGTTDFLIRIGNAFFLPYQFITTALEGLPSGSRLLVAEHANVQVPGRELKRFHDARGIPTVVLYEVRFDPRAPAQPH